MSKNKNRQLNQLKTIVLNYVNLLEREKFPVKEAYLFGSFAKGQAHNGSDIDICIVSSKFNPNRDKDRFFLWRKVRDVDYRIEPVGFSPADFVEQDPLVYEIKNFGIRVV